jgi:hypothetical protein
MFAVLAPKATPPDVRRELENAIVTPDARERPGIAGVEAAADGAAELARRIDMEPSCGAMLSRKRRSRSSNSSPSQSPDAFALRSGTIPEENLAIL